MKKKNDFLITCVIPCYNVELYIEEAILSVVNQSIGFDKIELIIINDGSSDNTEKIIKKYVKKYPNNIVYIKQENSGVSIARNKGISLARGKYVTLLDGDDTWDKTAFSKGIKMLDKYSEINFVSFRVFKFEGLNRYHVLDYKYDKDKIVDILEEPTMVQTLATAIIYRTKFIKNYTFDSRIKYSEDAKFMCDLFFDIKKYGIISSANYNGRVRANSTSAVQGCLKKMDWYTITISDVYEYIAKRSIKEYGKILDYFQLVILYEFQWRFFTIREDTILNDKELKKYYNSLVKLVRMCDDKNILLSPGANDYKRRKILEIKYNGNIFNKLKIKGNSLCLEDTKVIDKDDLFIRLIKIESKDRIVNLKFRFNMFATDELYLYVNGKKIKSNKQKDNSNLLYDEREFYIDIFDFTSNKIYLFKNYKLYIMIDNKKCLLDVKFPTAINDELEKNGYYSFGNFKLFYDNKTIKIRKNK